MESGALPLVSVIIPCYNASAYVAMAVRSIMEQSYTNLEILCCDDASTDNTLAILGELGGEDSRVKVYHNKTNLNLSLTLNRLIGEAKGEYIARMDSDDISMLDRIAKQVHYLQKHRELALCATNAWYIDANGERLGESSFGGRVEEVYYAMKYACHIIHPTVMFRSSVAKANLYDSEYVYTEDYELWCRLLYTKGLKLATLKDNLLCYRRTDTQISSSKKQRIALTYRKLLCRYKLCTIDKCSAHMNLFLFQKATGAPDIEHARECLRQIAIAPRGHARECLTLVIFKALWAGDYIDSVLALLPLARYNRATARNYSKALSYLWARKDYRAIFALLRRPLGLVIFMKLAFTKVLPFGKIVEKKV